MSSSKKEALFIASLIALWYSSNIGVLLLNKFLLSNYGFRFPIFLTMCHMSACAILSYLSIVFLKIVPLQAVKSRPQLLKIATLSVVFCGSVVGGNISLRYLPVSFNQAVGATTPFFTAVFAYLMTFKREAWVTYAALVPVVVGVIIASGVSSFLFYGSSIGYRIVDISMPIHNDVTYDKLIILFSLFVGLENGGSCGEFAFLKSVITFWTRKVELDEFAAVHVPDCCFGIIPAALIMEPNVLDVTLELGRKHKYMWLLLLLNSTVAFSANLTNFLVTKHTSALTLQVLGNAKGAVAVVISIFIFRNPVTFVGIAGYSMTVLGVVAYGEAKRRFR
ncbi:hypothetical protein POTOM_052461 [Populus tomentosa]|uniref:Sugar phosphate transporter domain-containing protein n=1 Tax=Populus tomentosa TaxID=118781 RepID=A0A8X7Y598_POPTO|nr:hypothetical protein POTOM_052461 [Populus tomentosa]